VGGVGSALGQIFRNNFPSQSIGVGMQIQAKDRVAEADYAIDQLSLRQQQLGLAKSLNQAQVDIMNSIVALRQARARYEAAVQNRILQQQLYEAEQKKFAAGESTAYNVTQQQRDFVAGQSTELSALVGWENARISLDQNNTGATLDVYHVSIAEAQAGKVARPSQLPATLP
jgi:outer membrane protein TolC